MDLEFYRSNIKSSFCQHYSTYQCYRCGLEQMKKYIKQTAWKFNGIPITVEEMKRSDKLMLKSLK